MAGNIRPIWKFLGIFLVVGGVVAGGYKFATSTGAGGKALVSLQGKAAATGAGKVAELNGVPAINVCVVTWGGYAGGEYFNGGFRASEKSRFWSEYGLPVNFLKIDDFTASRDAWKADECQVIWTTVDAFTTEAGPLSEHGAQMFFIADKSRGGDVLVATRAVRTMKDLCRSGQRRKVAVLKGSPSHTLLLKALEAQGCSESDIEVVSANSAPNAAEIFKNGEADAAAVWSPDDQDCLQNVPGSHVLFSTKQATNIIADAFVAKRDFIAQNEDRLVALVEGWLKGNAELNSSAEARAGAARILADGLGVSEDFAAGSMANARFVTYGDNADFFGLKSGYTGVTGKYIYEDMGRRYRDVGMVEGALPKWGDVVNTSILRRVSLSGPEHRPEGTTAFTKADESVKTSEALASRGVTVEFPFASAALTEDAKIELDTEAVGTIRSFEGARIRIVGNTDSVGSEESNRTLSLRRAESVKAYLVTKFGYDPDRFVTVGAGASKPVADNGTADGRAKNRRTDIEVVTQ